MDARAMHGALAVAAQPDVEVHNSARFPQHTATATKSRIFTLWAWGAWAVATSLTHALTRWCKVPHTQRALALKPPFKPPSPIGGDCHPAMRSCSWPALGSCCCPSAPA
jgi:hypothetical protein